MVMTMRNKPPRLLLLLCFSVVCLQVIRAQEQKPNLLFILTDQQRFDTLSFIQDEMPEFNGKLKINTPNIDRLAARGAYFRNTYCQSASCSPSRTTLRTGTTVERHGVQDNDIRAKRVYTRDKLTRRKLESLRSYDQILVEKVGYQAEHYGKWHLPLRLLYDRSGERPIISANDYDLDTSIPRFVGKENFKEWDHRYKKVLESYLLGANDLSVDVLSSRVATGNYQINELHGTPYEPISLDSRYNKPPLTTLERGTGMFEGYELNSASTMGRSTLPTNLTDTMVLGRMGIMAIKRLATAGVPWALTLSFARPHPPMVASSEYFDYYYQNRSQIFVRPSIHDTMEHSAYREQSSRQKLLDGGYEKMRNFQFACVLSSNSFCCCFVAVV
jgi:hypothetical protein